MGTQQQAEGQHPSPAACRTAAPNFFAVKVTEVQRTAHEETDGDKALCSVNQGSHYQERAAGGAPGWAGFSPARCAEAHPSKQQVWQVPLNPFSYTPPETKRRRQLLAHE